MDGRKVANMNFRFTKLFSLILALVLLVGVAPALGVAAEAVEITPVNIPMYGRSALATMDNSTALLYAYDQLAAGIENAEESITVYNGTDLISMDEIQVVMDAYRRDYTYHFWLGTSYSVSSYVSIDTVVRVIPTYLLTGEALETAKEQFNNAAEEILSGITPGMSDYEKELYLHDKLAEKITYTMGTIHAHDAYGALVEGQSVCEGYAESLQYLLQRCGIQSFIIEGGGFNPATGTYEAHAWNAVKIDGQFAHVDLTWNDQGEDTYHAYFNVTDSMIQQDHVIDVPVYPLPACTSDSNFYFKQTGGYLDSYTVEQMGKLLKDTKGEAHVYIPGDMQTFLNWYTANIRDIAKAAGVTGSFSYGYSYLGREMILTIPQLQVEEPEHTHSYDAEVTDPTCTEVGCTTYTCDCGDSYAEEIPALGHEEVVDKAVAATCITTGLTEGKHCNFCGAVLIAQDLISVTGHTPNIPVPTENEDQVCTVCGIVLVEKTGHVCKNNLTYVSPKDPTCTEFGAMAHYACSCGKTYEDADATVMLNGVIINVLGHEENTVAGYAAACTTDGKTDGKTCTRCGQVLTEQETIPAPGHVEEILPKLEPTCTSAGRTEGKECSVCGEILTAQETIAALGHTEVVDEAVDATCKAIGLTEGTHCATCNTVLVAQTVVNKMPHTEEIIPAVDATCTTTGLTEGKKCAVCGETLTAQEEIPALDHTEETIPGVDPTCTTDGKTEGKKCSTCGTTLLAQKGIPALGHTPEVVPGYGATCTEPGLTDGEKCGTCAAVTKEQTAIPAAGHAWDNGICENCGKECEHSYEEEGGSCTICGGSCAHDYETTVTKPGCTAQGYTTYTCTICGNSYNGDYVDALGHDWKAATCTASKTCAVCGITEGIANGHNYASVVTAPTCTVKGYTTHTCSACGHSYTDSETQALGHVSGTPVEENRVEAGCTAEGSFDTVVYCTACNAELSREKHATPAVGHSYGDWTIVTDATCTADGEQRRVCENCDQHESEAIPALGHDWNGDTCDRCGESNSPYKVELTLADNSIDSVWVDGKEYPVTKIAGGIRVELADENATNLVIYTYNDPDASDIHAQYPIGMRVWLLSYEDGYTATYVPEFDNLLRYSGSSIRVTGKKGIRMITSIDKDLRTSLMNEGLAGYTLVEYGTAVSWTANGTPILGKDSTMSNYAYRKGVADPIFQDTGDLIQYTNVLVGFSDAQCAADLAMRPYIILENAEGEQITLYGGQVTRSIGYIAYQNRDTFDAGTEAYDYVWEIIHHVYGDKFD